MQDIDVPLTERDIPNVRFQNLKALKVHRVPTLKLTAENPTEIPIIFRVVRKKQPDWTDKIVLKPNFKEWVFRQQSAMCNFPYMDDLLQQSFNLLDIQQLPTINTMLE